MPEEGEDIKEHLIRKYGPSAAQRFNDPNSQLRKMGRDVGIEFTNDRKAVNTKRAHALMEYIKEKDNDLANEFMEDMYKAYFVHGKDINDPTILKEIAIQDKYNTVIEGKEEIVINAMRDDYVAAVSKQADSIRSKFGISGVPFFMVHPNKGGTPVAFSGAYPVDIIAEQLEIAAEE